MLAARRAAEAGRVICAVPGPVTSSSSAGCHQLIIEGTARLVTDTDDVFAAISEQDTPLIAFVVHGEARRTKQGQPSHQHIPPFQVTAPSAAHAASLAFDIILGAQPQGGVQLRVSVQGPSGDVKPFSIGVPG
jgi:DNA processing protein